MVNIDRHRQGYIDNCPLRTDFLEVIKIYFVYLLL